MKKVVIVLLSLAVLIRGFLILYQNRAAQQKIPASPATGRQASTSGKWESKVDDQASVTVTITPLDFSPGLKEWKFDIVMDTHSIELDQDLMKSVVLIDSRGREYPPINWEGPTGGHHREGTLTFNAAEPVPSAIEIKVKDIAGISERSFKWSLE